MTAASSAGLTVATRPFILYEIVFCSWRSVTWGGEHAGVLHAGVVVIL